MSIPKILVTGADGQLGQSLRRLSDTIGADFVFTTRTELDIAQEESIDHYFTTHHIDVCINTAAYTKVDLAEKESQLAYQINSEAPAHLARACKNQGAILIHISSDYVYHNALRRPLREDDPVFPASVYAKTKLEGEQNALRYNPRTIIIRTSWVFSEYGHNFVKTIVRLMKEGKPLRVVNDQIGCPTYAGDLAQAILKIIQDLRDKDNKKFGVFNYYNEGSLTWYGFAVEIAQMLDLDVRITPVTTREYPTPAARPPYSVLDTAKIQEVYHIRPPHWRTGLASVLQWLSAKGIR